MDILAALDDKGVSKSILEHNISWSIKVNAIHKSGKDDGLSESRISQIRWTSDREKENRSSDFLLCMTSLRLLVEG